MKKLNYFIFIFMCYFYANAQNNGVVSGRITETETNFSLPGAIIKLLSYSFNYLLLYPYKLRVLPKSFLKLGYQK